VELLPTVAGHFLSLPPMNLAMMALTVAVALILVAGVQARSLKVFKAAPVTTPTPSATYKLRNGQVVAMSESQIAIANGHAHPYTPQEIARIAKSITVKVMAKIDDRETRLGTGFFISEHLIQTVYHTVRGSADITVTDGSGVEHTATWWSASPAADLAILNVADAQSKHWASFATDSDLAEVGEKVYIYGNPLGVEGTFTDGMLSAVRNNGALLQISAPLDHGSSGSPVFNSYGLVIGIDDMKMAEGAAELNLAISSNVMIEAQRLKNADHPTGFNIGVTTGLELRSPEQITDDILAVKTVKVADAIREAFEQILEDVKQFAPDKNAAYAWTVTMRDYGAWSEYLTADYWLHQVIERYEDPDAQARLLADVNALLKLQGRVLLSPSDDTIRAENEKALQQAREGQQP
jgi:Trypsin-like peptidase domain